MGFSLLMTKQAKADMINAAISRSPFAIAKKCKANVVEGTIFYTMQKGRDEKFVKLSAPHSLICSTIEGRSETNRNHSGLPTRRNYKRRSE